MQPVQLVTRPQNAAPAGSRWRLIAESNSLAGKEFTVPEGDAAIGRDSNCELVIAGAHLSRRHAQLSLRAGQLSIRDLGSANGTYVNDTKINGEIVLRSGDRLQLDVYSFRIQGPVATHTPARKPPAASANPAPDAERPKQWITKPTSPGNRQEPARPGGSRWMLAASITLCLSLVSVLVYIVSSRI